MPAPKPAEQQRIRTAHRAGWPELERRNLMFQPLRIVIHKPSGDSYRISRAEVDVDSADIAAYFVDVSGDTVFLEPPARWPAMNYTTLIRSFR